MKKVERNKIILRSEFQLYSNFLFFQREKRLDKRVHYQQELSTTFSSARCLKIFFVHRRFHPKIGRKIRISKTIFGCDRVKNRLTEDWTNEDGGVLRDENRGWIFSGRSYLARKPMTSGPGNACTLPRRNGRKSARKIRGYLFHDLSSETETCTRRAWANLSADTQRRLERRKRTNLCAFVCMRERQARPRGLIRCKLIQAVSLSLRIVHTRGRGWTLFSRLIHIWNRNSRLIR